MRCIYAYVFVLANFEARAGLTDIDYDEYDAVVDWCDENIGPDAWGIESRVIGVKTKAGAFAFKMRWC